MENDDSSSSLSPSPLLEIVVVSDMGDGPEASKAIGVSATLGSCNELHSKDNSVLDLHVDKERFRLFELVSGWKKTTFKKIKQVSDHVTEKVTPNMAIAFLALTIQNIYQMASSMFSTTSGGKGVQQVNGAVVILLLYGLLMPKGAGGRIALIAGVFLASLAAVVLSFKN